MRGATVPLVDGHSMKPVIRNQVLLSDPPLRSIPERRLPVKLVVSDLAVCCEKMQS